MHRRLLVLAGAAIAMTVAVGYARAQAAHTRADAEAIVLRAMAYLAAHGQAATAAAINDPNGPFRDGDLYCYMLDTSSPDLTMLAHGANLGLVGLPQRDVVDADGKDFNALTMQLVNADQGQGWVTYRWPNPMTRHIAKKASFVKRVSPGVIIGAGIYE